MEALARRLQTLLWPEQLPANPAVAVLLHVARYAFGLGRDFVSGEINLRAMSLVYTTIWSIVPLLAFSFSVAKGLGLHRQLEPILLGFLEPIGAERAAEVSESVLGFVDNISGSVLASVSIGLLLLSALSMAQKVESSLNYVWRVDRPRSFARRFSEYLSVMFVGPLMMVVATGLIAAVSSVTVVERLREMEPFGSLIAGLGATMPYLLIVAAFGFLYLLIPNTRVQLRAALIGGLFAGITWAASGKLFASIVVTSTRFEAIYSGFAIVIVIMFRLYVSWLILLLGAQLAFYLQNPYHLRLGQRTETMANGLRERLAVNVMLLIARDFDAPGHGWRTESLASELRVPRATLEPVMTALSEAGLVANTADSRLMPARDPRRISAATIIAAVRRGAHETRAVTRGDWNPTVANIASSIERAIENALGERTLADLVDEDIERQQPPAD